MDDRFCSVVEGLHNDLIGGGEVRVVNLAVGHFRGLPLRFEF